MKLSKLLPAFVNPLKLGVNLETRKNNIMEIELIIARIRTLLLDTVSSIDSWFDKEIELLSYRPINGGWTISEILEHIGLTNYFLLILIDKGTRKALEAANKANLESELKNYVFHFDKLIEVGQHNSFKWIRPEHMEPKGEKCLAEVRVQLKDQLEQCLLNLDRLKAGQGVLYKTTMSVNNLGKIDVYEYIFFLAQHGQRHLTQMEKIDLEFKEQ